MHVLISSVRDLIRLLSATLGSLANMIPRAWLTCAANSCIIYELRVFLPFEPHPEVVEISF